jgi:hypothetical protein
MTDAEADRRGFALLTRNLSAAQRAQFAAQNCFDVIGGDSGKRYQIRSGATMNVVEFDATGKMGATLCFYPSGDLPRSDIMLAQKIALELFENDALQIANRKPINRFLESCQYRFDPPSWPQDGWWEGIDELHQPRGRTPDRQDAPPRDGGDHIRPSPGGTPAAGATTRNAQRGDRLLTADFGFLEGGFTTIEEPHVAVRVMNGCVLEFDEGIEYRSHGETRRFAQRTVTIGIIPVDYPEVSLVLRMNNGEVVPLHRLTPGQRATVISAVDPDQAQAEIARLTARRWSAWQ